ncbi:MAG: sensor histidine kinase, partial [Thermoplasmata archaeon]|nr:sensor histidine kinase [Thermoplasmata archaeon]
MEDPYEYINQTDSEWTSVPINQISPFMQSLMDNNLSVNLTNRLVEHYVIEHGLDIYREILVTNKYGALVAMTSRSMDYMQGDDEWWQLTVENEFYIGDVSYDECARMYGVPVCLSVYDYSGEFAGVMRGFIDLVAVAEEAGLFEPAYETEDTRILTNNGSLIYSSRAFVFMDNLSEENYYSGSSEDSGYFIAEEGGRPRLFGYYHSTGYLDYSGHDWLVLVSYDSAEVMQPLSELRISITMLALLLAAASVFVTHMFARSITSPIKRLTKAAIDMSHGDLDRRVEVDRKDEIGQLAQAFNGMAEELDDLYEDLEVKVATRTAELQVANKKLGILGSITRHDALNQLTVLRGWLSMAQETVKNEATRQYLHKVELASENVASYLNFTGEYEKVGIKNPEWLSVSESFVTSTFGLNLAGIEVKTNLDLLEVYADPMFPKVIRNLVDNSVKHGRSVTKISLSYSESTDGLMLVYADNGQGVPIEVKAKLFERVPRAGRKSHGLYLSREILLMTGLSIRETGTPGEGVRFEISVPRGKYRFADDPFKVTK